MIQQIYIFFFEEEHRCKMYSHHIISRDEYCQDDITAAVNLDHLI